MLFKTLLNHVQPYKGFIYKAVKLATSYDRFQWQEERLVVEIEPRVGSKAICSACSRKAPGYDRLPVRLYDYLPVLGVLVYFAYSRRSNAV